MLNEDEESSIDCQVLDRVLYCKGTNLTRAYLFTRILNTCHFVHRSAQSVVSFAAVIRVVTRHATLLPTSGEERCVTIDDPNNGCEGDYTVWDQCSRATVVDKRRLGAYCQIPTPISVNKLPFSNSHSRKQTPIFEKQTPIKNKRRFSSQTQISL